MFSQFGSNERHFVKIKEIIDSSYMDYPYVTLSCYGYIFHPSKGSESKVSKSKYTIIVRCYGFMMSFVLNELSVGDNICVIGHSATAKLNGFATRVTEADQIYKADWENYFSLDNIGNGVSWL